jgi:nitrite reductase/ring-hydroxylating ferredoxin subunit
MTRVRVCAEDELEAGDHHVVEHGGHEIGVVNVDGDLYGISNVCAHMGGPVCEGKVQGALVGEYQGPGKRVNEYFSDDPAIACPLHGWEYDLASGVHLADDDIQIPTYDVVVEDGDVYVEV